MENSGSFRSMKLRLGNRGLIVRLSCFGCQSNSKRKIVEIEMSNKIYEVSIGKNIFLSWMVDSTMNNDLTSFIYFN